MDQNQAQQARSAFVPRHTTVALRRSKSQELCVRPKSKISDDLDSPCLRLPRNSSDTVTCRTPAPHIQISRKQPCEEHSSSNWIKDSSSSCSPEDVSAQTEDILMNFMYERYNKDLMSLEERIEAPPSVAMLLRYTPNSQGPMSEVGRTLASFAAELDTRYDVEFRRMIHMLNLHDTSMDCAYDTFCNVCRELFSDGVITWGRIVALLQFGYYIAMETLRQRLPDNFMAKVIKYLVWFITFEKIARAANTITHWISSQGGWGAMEGVRSTFVDYPMMTMISISASVAVMATVFYFEPRQLSTFTAVVASTFTAGKVVKRHAGVGLFRVGEEYKACMFSLRRHDQGQLFIDRLEGLSCGQRARLFVKSDERGSTLLHTAALCAVDVKVVRYMLNCVPVNTAITILKSMGTQTKNQTPLHMSVRNEKLKTCCTELVKFIMSAYRQNAKDVEEILLSKDEQGCTFFHHAARHRSASLIKQLLACIPPDIVARLLAASNKWEKGNGWTVFHLAVLNKKHGKVILELLEFVEENYCQKEVRELLSSKDYAGDTYLHLAARSASAVTMKGILAILPKLTTVYISRMPNTKGRMAHDVAKSERIRRYLETGGSYPAEFYPLQTPPQILIFYSTKNRQSSESGAEEEKDCVEQYFVENNFPCTVKKNPTEADIFSGISAAQDDSSLSGLVVFVMTHGQKGLVSVEGDPDFLMIQDIITHMCRKTANKPKMLVVQACQRAHQPNNRTGSSALWTQRVDPLAVGGSKYQAMKEGMSLKQPDFLLYQATVSGSYALRNVLIPCFVDSLRELGPYDDIQQACLLTNEKVEKELRRIDPGFDIGQLPKVEYTMKKYFCLGQKYYSSSV